MEFIGNEEIGGDRIEKLNYFLKNGQNVVMMGGDIICSKIMMKLQNQQRLWDDKTGQMEQMGRDRVNRLERDNDRLQEQLNHVKIENEESNRQTELLQNQVDG